MQEIPVDLTNLRAAIGGDIELERELIDEFFMNSKPLIGALKEASFVAPEESNDDINERWRANAHALKGISLNLGAKKLSELAALAQESYMEDFDRKQSQYQNIQDEYLRVVSFLKKQ